MDNIDKDVERITKEMIEKQNSCIHWMYNIIEWPIIDPGYMSFDGSMFGFRILTLKECSNCGKRLT